MGLLALGMVPRSGSADEPRPLASLAPPRPAALADMWGDNSLVDPVSHQGQHARGLYFNGPTMRVLGARRILTAVHSSGMNAVVLDLKDGQGRIMWDTQVPEVRGQHKRFVKDMPRLIAEYRQERREFKDKMRKEKRFK